MDTAPLQPYRRTQLFKVPLSVELAETLVAVLILFAVPLFLLIQCAKKNKPNKKSKSPEVLEEKHKDVSPDPALKSGCELNTADEKPETKTATAGHGSDEAATSTLTPSQQAKLQAELAAAVRAQKTREEKAKLSKQGNSSEPPKQETNPKSPALQNKTPEDVVVQSAYVHSKPGNVAESAYVPKPTKKPDRPLKAK